MSEKIRVEQKWQLSLRKCEFGITSGDITEMQEGYFHRWADGSDGETFAIVENNYGKVKLVSPATITFYDL